MFAAAHSSNVKIFSMYDDDIRMIHNLRGHKDRVLSMCWSEDDSSCTPPPVMVRFSVNTRNGQSRSSSRTAYQWSDIRLHPDQNSDYVYAMGQFVSSDEPRSSLVEIRWRGGE